ncbi:PHP domain-containing protein, partial [Parvimonas micra]
MYRSLKSFYFSQRKNYSLSDDFIIDEFIFGDEKISFRLLTNSDDIGIEELIVLDKELHEIFNGREVDFSVQNFSKSEYPYKYFYYINYDEFVNEVQKLLKNHGFSLTNSDRINFLEDYIEIFISNSLCRFKLISNSFLDDLKEFISGKFTEDIELIMLNCLITREEKSCEKLDNKLENKRKEIKQENKIKAEKVKVNKESTEENSLFRLGKKISDKDPILKISDLDQNSGFCKIQGRVYDLEIRELKSGKKLALFDIEDETSAMNCKWFLDEKKLSIFNNNINKDSIKKGIYVTAIGRVEYDQYAKGISMMIDGMEKSSSFVYIDNAPEKRVELHLNSQMSGLDGCVNLEVLKSRLEEMGHTAVGVTDIGVVQAYPKMMDLFGKSDIKALYGLELNLLEDNPRILYNYKDGVNFDTFVVFDIETTGLSHLK